MANYVYLIVNATDHTAIAVDAAWDQAPVLGFRTPLPRVEWSLWPILESLPEYVL